MASTTQAGSLVLLANSDQPGTPAVTGFLALCGLLNSLIAAFLLCRLPETHAPSLTALFLRAILYVFLGGVAGAAGAWFYWRRISSSTKSSLPFSLPLFALTNAACWVFTPAIALLWGQATGLAAAISAIAAAILASGLRKVVPSSTASFEEQWPVSPWEERELFAQSLRTPAREPYGYAVAACIYAGSYALIEQEYLGASALFAFGAFLFVWRDTHASGSAFNSRIQCSRAARRLSRIAAASVLVTVFALMEGVEHRNRAALVAASARNTASDSDQSNRKQPANAAGFGFAGYQSIVLWPEPPKKEIVAPIRPPNPQLEPRMVKPIVVRFTGSYWYFQPPATGPGPKPHAARGSPLDVNIHSTDFLPIVMEAHQSLAAPMRLSRCREMQVLVENRDNQPGRIAIGVLLTDSAAHGKPTLFLGQQSLHSADPDRFALKLAPVEETLRFPIPARTTIRRFDEITLMVVPDSARVKIGARIAIEELQFLPR
jgi:hypothetical protein